MRVIKASAEIVSFTQNLETNIEQAGRVCWKSEDKITDTSYEPFIERIKGMQHESVLEHGAITVKFICDRGITHELVRHRVASFSQESTRYANYSKNKFGNEITVIEPYFFTEDDGSYQAWYRACLNAEASYLSLINDLGHTAQEARAVLPTCLKTELFMTANPREWRHVFKMRCPQSAHPQMREIMKPLLIQFANKWPVLFEDIAKQFD